VKAILCLPLLIVSGALADEAQDRAAIDQVIGLLNDPVQRGRLWTDDADSTVDFDHLLDLHRSRRPVTDLTIGMDETWTELTVPRVVSGPIRFVTPTVAIVDGASTIRGAVTLAQRVPLLFVMKKDGAEWKVALASARCGELHSVRRAGLSE
jgi:hypothetical protein